MTPKSNALKCYQDIRSYPPEAYRLPDDGRQWNHKCVQRQRIAHQLAGYANPDGTGVKVGASRIAEELGMVKATVVTVMKELIELGLVVNVSSTHPVERRLNVAVLESGKRPTFKEANLPGEASLGTVRGQSSASGEANLHHREANLHDEEANLRESNLRVIPADSGASNDPSICTVLPQDRTPHRLTEGEARKCVRVLKEEAATLYEQPWPMDQKTEQHMVELCMEHGATEFLAAARRYVNDPPPAVNARTKFPWMWFDYDAYAAQVRAQKTKQPIDIEATDAMALYRINKSDSKPPIPMPDTEDDVEAVVQWYRKYMSLPEHVRFGRAEEPSGDAFWETSFSEEEK